MNWSKYDQSLLSTIEEETIFDMLDGRSLLITGANGLIASCLIDLIMQANRIGHTDITLYALCRSKEYFSQRFFRYDGDRHLFFVQGDIISPPAMGFPIDYVIQCASPSHPAAFSQNPVNVIETNYTGTKNLLDYMRCHNGKRFLFVSSGEVYGQAGDVESFREDMGGYIDCNSSRACYPEGKRIAEALCSAYTSQYGIDTVIARPCHIYGPMITQENNRADAQFLRDALLGEDIVMKSTGSQVRSYCYVMDVAVALLYILLKGVMGEAYNISNDQSVVSIRDYASALANMAGVALNCEEPSETEKRGYSKVSRSVLNAEKLRGIGWTPKFSLEKGLHDTLQIAGPESD